MPSPNHAADSRWRPSGRMNLLAVIIAMGLPSLVTWVYFVQLSGNASRAQQLAFAIGKTAQFSLPMAWFLVAQRGRLLWPRPTARGCGLGILLGSAAVATMYITYAFVLEPRGLLAAASDRMVDKVRGFGVSAPAGYLGLSVFYALCHSGLEEYYWRWFVFGQLQMLIGFSGALVVSSLSFMAHHVILLALYFGGDSPLTYLFSFCVAVAGAAWAWLYRSSGSLLGPCLSHLIVDAGIFLIGYDIVSVTFR